MEIEREALRCGWDAAGDQEHLAAVSTDPGALDIWASRGGRYGTRVFNVRSNRGTVKGTRDGTFAVSNGNARAASQIPTRYP